MLSNRTGSDYLYNSGVELLDSSLESRVIKPTFPYINYRLWYGITAIWHDYEPLINVKFLPPSR